MKTADIIVSALFIVAIFGPFIYLYLLSKRNKYRLRQKLYGIEYKFNLTLTQWEVFGDKAIGVDSINQKLIFVRKVNSVMLEQLIDLKLISQIAIVNTRSLVCLHFYGVVNQSIEFFNVENDEPLDSGTYHLICMRWFQTIEPLIKNNSNPVKAA